MSVSGAYLTGGVNAAAAVNGTEAIPGQDVFVSAVLGVPPFTHYKCVARPGGLTTVWFEAVGVFVQLTAVAYSLLTTEQQNNGTIYFITDES
jgi:hypothetical protein